MKRKIFEAVLDEYGRIALPVNVLQEMGLKIGDSLEFSYPCATESIEQCLRIEGYYAEEDMVGESLYVPYEILRRCSLNNKPMHMFCSDEKMVIVSSDKVCETIPRLIMDIFAKFEITNEQVASAIAEAIADIE